MFYKYSAVQNYCFHSDWLTGYMIEYYLLDDDEHDQQKELLGAEYHPSCGNFTETGSIRPCEEHSMACHKQTPKDMEALSISKYAENPDSYTKNPRLEQSYFDIKAGFAINTAVFPPIYWINLDKTSDRRRAMQASFQSLGISNTHRVSATNIQKTTALWQSGHLVFHPQVQLHHATQEPEVPIWKKHSENIYHFSEAASLQSHLNAIKQAYRDGHDLALILEDDAMLSATFRDSLMDYVSSHAPKDWKVLQFATNNPGLILHGALLHEAFVSWQPYHWSARAYLINRAGMQTLMDRSHSLKAGRDVWSIQGQHPMVVADEVIYASLMSDAYTSTGLWVDAFQFESTVQSESSEYISSVVSSSSYSAAGDMTKQVAMKSEPQMFKESLLVLMSVRIASEEDIERQLQWILQDNYAVCKFHPVCQWEVNLVVTTSDLNKLFQEVSSSRLPSNVHIHAKVNPNKFNKFLFIRDFVNKFQFFDLLLFKDNDQRISGFPWHTFVQRRENATIAGPLRATTGENMVASLGKTKSQWFQFHESKQWVASKTEWGPKHFASIQPIDVPFLEMYFVLLDPKFASDFFKRILTDDTVGQASNWGVDAIWCQAAAEWEAGRPGCRLVPVVSVHEDSRQIVKDKKHYDSGSKAVEILQKNPTFGVWMDASTGWRELVGRRRTLQQIEQVFLKQSPDSMQSGTFDMQVCAKVLRAVKSHDVSSKITPENTNKIDNT